MSTLALPERGLVIRHPWAEMVAAGTKTWEIRRRPTKVRGRIGLIAGGTGTVIGEAVLTDCAGPFTPAELAEFEAQHRVSLPALEEYAPATGLYAWVMADAVTYSSPRPYRHPAGAVIFVDLANNA